MKDQAPILKRIDGLLSEYEKLRQKAKYDDLSGGTLTDAERTNFDIRAVAAITSIALPNSPYVQQIYFDGKRVVHAQNLVGILQALKADIEAGYLYKINELIHADIFSDFLEMAEHLLREGYKDASAVLIGGVLEEHIRKLCIKSGVPIEIQKDGKTAFKKASTMNDDLKKNGIHGGIDHKNINAWLELRNKAAHGKYAEYTKDHVELMLSGISNFIAAYPA